ncbi:MAG: mercury(II) reductase [bacterium]
MKNFDLVILGGGAAAFAAATRANELEVKTAMINAGTIGGTCVNVGCVPSKHLLEVGNAHFYPGRIPFRSIKGDGSSLDFPEAIREKDEVIGALRQSNYVNVVEGMKHVTLIEGRGKFVSPSEVDVDGERIRGEKFIIATGSSSRILPFLGIDDVDYITNVEALNLKRLPKSMVVVGAGPLGLEFAQMYRHFGTNVTVLEKEPRILPLAEPEVSDELQRCLEEEGIEIHTGIDIERVWQDGGRKFVSARTNGGNQTFEGEELLMATGVIPNTKDLALREAGVKVDGRGFVEVNDHLQTSAPHIFAAGDVVGRAFLETVAAKEGAVAAANALEGAGRTIDYDSIPRAVFTMPQVASVGLTEEELMRRYNICSCRTVRVEQIPKARAIKETRGLIKMVIHPRTSQVVGVHIVAPLAADMIHEATLAVKFKLTIDDIIDTVHVFPTMSEGIKLAAQAFVRDISRMSCCVE